MPATFVSEYHIDAPPEAVVAAMTDFSTWDAWMRGLVGIERLTEGPYCVGTKWRETRKMFGHEASEVFEVTQFDPPESIALYVDGSQGATGKGEFRFLYTLTPTGDGGTHLRMDGEIVMPGFAAKIFGFLFKGMFKKACDRDTEALKAYVEGAASP